VPSLDGPPQLWFAAEIIEQIGSSIEFDGPGSRYLVKLINGVRETEELSQAAQICRQFRRTHFEPLWCPTVISRHIWLPIWREVERRWHVSNVRGILSEFFLDLLANQRRALYLEILVVELACIYKHLPLLSQFENDKAEDRYYAIGPRQKSHLVHPYLDCRKRIGGSYCFSNPDWELPFIADTVASAADKVVARPLGEERLTGNLTLIGHVGHCGSTLFSRVLQQRLRVPIIREPLGLGPIVRENSAGEIRLFFSELLQSDPRPGGVKLSSDQLVHIPNILKELRGSDIDVSVYVLRRDVHEIAIRALRSNSLSLPDKVWSSSDVCQLSPSGLLNYLIFTNDFVQKELQPLASVSLVDYSDMRNSLALTRSESVFLRNDLKALSNPGVDRSLTQSELDLESAMADEVRSTDDV